MSTRTTTDERRRLGKIEAGADRLAVSPRTIRRYVAEGKLTGYRVGGKLLRVDLDEVDALAHRIPTAGD